MIAADETFDGTWPYEAHYFEETPQDRSYSAQEHTENLIALLLDLGLRDITIIGQDWGGVINGQFVYRNHERVKRIVLIDSFMKVATMDPERAGQQQRDATPWMEFILSDAFEPVMSHLGSTILSVLHRIGFTQTERITDTWVRAYGAPFPTPEECRGALQFPRNLLLPESWKYMQESEDLPGAMDAVREKPALLIQGEQDQSMPPDIAEMAFRMIWPNAPIVTLPHSGHYLQEDAPEVAVALIENFIQTTG